MALGLLFGIKKLTHFLDPLEFGRLALANTVVLLVGTNLFGPLGQGFMRYWSISQESGRLEEFVLVTNRYARLLTSIILAVSLILVLFMAFTEWLDWAVLLLISLIVGTITGYFGVRMSVLLAARKRKIVALVNTGTSFFKPFIGALFVVFFVSKADCVMSGYLVTTFAIMCVVEHLYKKTLKDFSGVLPGTKQPKAESGNLGREILSFSWPFCVWGMFGWMHQSCDRWSLQAFHGSDVVGAFSVITLLAVYPLIFASGFLSNLFMPIAYERAGNLTSCSSIRSANRVLYIMTGAYIIAALILIIVFLLFHNEVVLLMSNAKYAEFSSLLPGLTSAWAFFYLGQMFSGFGLLANKPRKYILPIIVSALIAITTTFPLSKGYGPLGVVWGLGISGFIYAVWFMLIGLGMSNSIPGNARYPVDGIG
jgi:O-antigen/teichoic acid export membrane protein